MKEWAGDDSSVVNRGGPIKLVSVMKKRRRKLEYLPMRGIIHQCRVIKRKQLEELCWAADILRFLPYIQMETSFGSTTRTRKKLTSVALATSWAPELKKPSLRDRFLSLLRSLHTALNDKVVGTLIER